MNLKEFVRVANVFPHCTKFLPGTYASLVVHPLDGLQDDVHLGTDVAHHLVHRPLRLLLVAVPLGPHFAPLLPPVGGAVRPPPHRLLHLHAAGAQLVDLSLQLR